MGSFETGMAKAESREESKVRFLENIFDLVSGTVEANEELLSQMARHAAISGLIKFRESRGSEGIKTLVDALLSQDKAEWPRTLRWSYGQWSDRHEKMLLELLGDLSPFKGKTVVLANRSCGQVRIFGGALDDLFWDIFKEKHGFDLKSDDFVAILPLIPAKEIESYNV